MNRCIRDLQNELDRRNLGDFRFLKFTEEGILIIIGSDDFGYYHEVEITFSGVTYISCPTSFEFARFRLATKLEEEELKPKLFDGLNDIKICIVLDEEIDKSPIKHFIVAKEMKYEFSTTFYYKRENLKEGEKIADWVK